METTGRTLNYGQINHGWERLGKALLHGAEVDVWARLGGAGDSVLPVKVGASETLLEVEVAIDGPGNVEHGVSIYGSASREALESIGIRTA